MVGHRPKRGIVGRFPMHWRGDEYARTVAGRRGDEFVAVAEANFAFLTKEEGFIGPDRVAGGVVYHSPKLQIDVLFDEREKAIVTLARAFVDDLNLRANLSCLYATAGLGPAQEVKRTARPAHTLQRSMASQSAVLRKLLPTLMGPSRDRLMKACHAR
jgi:hypothetical protein